MLTHKSERQDDLKCLFTVSSRIFFLPSLSLSLSSGEFHSNPLPENPSLGAFYSNLLPESHFSKQQSVVNVE